MQKHTTRLEIAPIAGLGDVPLHIEADICWQRAAPPSGFVLFCLAGGGVHRQYFDMRPQGDASYSFAEALSGRGHIVVLLDHLGVGGSARPEDGFELTAARLATANAEAISALLAQIQAGQAAPALPAQPSAIPIGIGHSMGAMLAATQMAHLGGFAALALLCFATRGLPQYLTEAEVENLARPDQGRDAYPELARLKFAGDPYSPVQRARAGSAASDAVGDVQAGVLSTCAFHSMMPGNIAPEAAKLTCPIFLAVGDRDMTGPPHEIPASFPACPDISLVIVPQSGHHPFVSPNRAILFSRLAHFLTGLAQMEGLWKS